MVSYIISFFFNLVEKNLLRVNKFSKCCENGIACLRKGKLPRRHVLIRQTIGLKGQIELSVISEAMSVTDQVGALVLSRRALRRKPQNDKRTLDSFYVEHRSAN